MPINSFSNFAKVASVRSIFKKDDRTNIKNYRSVSLLNYFSKIYKNVWNEQLLHFVNHSLSDFMSVHGKGYSTDHVLIRLLKNWRKASDNNVFTGVDLIDRSKAIDCIPHDLLIAKLHAYGLWFDTVTFPFTYLKEQK